MTDRGYPILVVPTPEEDGGGFVALAPDLPGCFSAGDTQEEAVADVAAAIEEWIDEAVRLGRPVPPPLAAQSRAMEEQSKIHELVKKQDEIIQEQDKRLHDARREMEALRESVSALIDYDPVDHSAAYVFRMWRDVTIVPHHVAALRLTRAHH
jgi:predicted RNase H-like HicB family nuclease